MLIFFVSMPVFVPPAWTDRWKVKKTSSYIGPKCGEGL